jgi:sRNA-binding regulator protein Hfq
MTQKQSVPLEDNLSEDNEKITKKSIRRWVNTFTDKYFVKAIKNNISFTFKFLDNTCLEGKIQWFNKYTLSMITKDGVEYTILKHSIKYMIPN